MKNRMAAVAVLLAALAAQAAGAEAVLADTPAAEESKPLPPDDILRRHLADLRHILPAQPDADRLIAVLTAHALGGVWPPGEVVVRSIGHVSSFRCTAEAPRTLAGFEWAGGVGVLPLDCEAESGPDQPLGVIRLLDAFTRTPRLLIVEDLEYRASADSLHLRLRLLSPFGAGSAGLEGQALFERLFGFIESVKFFDASRALVSLLSSRASGDTLLTEAHVEGRWYLEGATYRLRSQPAWTASGVSPGSNDRFRFLLEGPRDGVSLALSPVGGVRRRVEGACTAVEMKGTWGTAPEPVAPEPAAPSTSSADNPKPGTEAASPAAAADEPPSGSFSLVAALCGKSLLPWDDMCRSNRDAPDRRVTVPPLSGHGSLTLRLRDADLADVFLALAQLSGQGFLVDEDVTGRADVDLSKVTLEEALRALQSAAGVSISKPDWIRRVSASAQARTWVAPSETRDGHPISLQFKRQRAEDVMVLMGDISGLAVQVRADFSGRVTIGLEERGWRSVLNAILDARGLTYRVDAGSHTLRVLPRGTATDPQAGRPARPSAQPPRRRGTEGSALFDARLVGIAASPRGWLAAFYLSPGVLHLLSPGERFSDGMVKAVAGDHVVVEWHHPYPLLPWVSLPLSLPLGPATAGATADRPAPAAEDSVGAFYERAVSEPVEATKRLAYRAALVEHLRGLGGEDGVARRAVRDGLAAAAGLDLASDPDVAGGAAILVQQAVQMGEPCDVVYDKLRALVRAFASGTLAAQVETGWPWSVLEVAHARNDLALEEQILRRELALHEERHGRGHAETLPILRDFARFLERSGKPEEALVLWDRAVPILEAEWARDPKQTSAASDYAEVLDAAGRLRSKAGNRDAALDRYAAALRVRAKALGAGASQVLGSLYFTDALVWPDPRDRAAAIARLREELAAQTDPTAASWYPKLWEAEWREWDSSSLARVRARIAGDLARASLAAGGEGTKSIREQGEAYLRPRVPWIHVKRFRQEGDRWVAEILEIPGPERPPQGIPRELRVGDQLADGVVKQVLPLGLFVEAELPRWWEGSTKQWLRFLPPQPTPPIALGHDTTWITSPLLPDGTPDYGAWLNAKYGAGVTPENNAAPLLQSAMAGLVEGPITFWEGLSYRGEDPTAPAGTRAQSRPWVDADCPECVARLDRNAQVLAKITEAVRRPRFFEPQPVGARLPFEPSLLSYRRTANALAGRGMLRIGRGDLKGAHEDALAIQRLGLLLGQGGPLIDSLIAVAIRGIGVPLLTRVASGPDADPALARSLLQDLVRLPQMRSMADAFDVHRVRALDEVLAQRQMVADRGGAAMLAWEDWRWPAADFSGGRQSGQLELGVLCGSRLDWDEVLRQVNRQFDLIASDLRAGSASEGQRARAALKADDQRRESVVASLGTKVGRQVRSEETKALDLARALDDVASSPEGRRRLANLVVANSSLVRAGVSWNEAETQFRLAVFSVALAVRRLETGNLPAELAALGPDLLPDPLGPKTPLPGYTLSYQRGVGSAGTSANYALIAVPEEKGETGVRGFCLDSTGVMRFTPDGTAPKVVGGRCDPESRLAQ